MNGKKSIVLTGAAGFIGANLTRTLLKNNFDVHIIIKKTTNIWRIKNVLSKTTCHYGDLTNSKHVTNVLSKVKPFAIYHLATYGSYPQQTNIDTMIEVNIKATYNLLIASKNIPYHIFVNMGTSSEYGWKNKPMKETDYLKPVSFYGTTKASAALLCQTFAYIFQKPIVTIRPFSVYGPYEQGNRFIPTIMNAIIHDTPIKLTKEMVRRDFIFVDDVVDALIKLLTVNGDIRGEIFNLGIGKEYSNEEVVKMLFTITRKKVKVLRGGYKKRSWDTTHWVANISHMKKLLSWKPSFSLEMGLHTTYQWFHDHTKFYETRNKPN